MFVLKKKYFFIIKSIKDIQLKNIKNFGKYSIIYRNNIPENIEKLKKFRLDCKIKKIPFFIGNNIKLMNAIKADGLYISAYNRKLNTINLKNNYKIIGSAHNVKEINLKKLQGCTQIFFSRLFKTSYKNKETFLGIVKFNLFARLIKTSLTPLGGINLQNLNKLQNINCENVALSSLIIEKTMEAQKVLK
ncbi:thiamine phosphate synthase [Pelagibacteraceae bacterium]|nr:thiamine phosphate synthase [Pelagibacteraceae bacterium]